MAQENNKEAILKAKYSELSREFDCSKKEQEVTEKILCRTIIRLTLATNGLDPALDPHLKKLRTLLKKGVKNELLRKQVDAVSEALLRAEDNDSQSSKDFDAAILFEFLSHCALNNDEKNSIQSLLGDYKKGLFSDLKSLFRAITQLLERGKEEAPSSKPGLISRLFGRKEKPKEESEEFDESLKKELLMRLLDSVDVPAYLRYQFESLKKQAGNSTDTGSLFFKMLEDVISMLLLIRVDIQEEQQEIDEFLLKVSRQIDQLESGSLGMRRFVKASSDATDTLNVQVTSNVSELKSASDGATTLAGLREAVATKLDSVVAQLGTHVKDEKVRSKKADQQINEMSSTIKALEAESARLKDAIKIKHDLAFSDSLTGLPNRLAYDERIESEFLRWKRFKEPLAMLIWDIDHFKKINDSFGHQAGDIALRTIGKVLFSGLRETDFIARYGGEEFVLLMPGASKEEAANKANELREAVKRCGLNSQGKPIKVTASCGLTLFCEGDTIETAFERADKAMYQAKNGGRDQCVLA
jgi:diguanylate cyclase